MRDDTLSEGAMGDASRPHSRSPLEVAASLAAYLGSVAIGLVAAGIAISVLLRAVTGRGIPGMNETSVLLMVAAAFLGFIEAERTETHVRATLLTSRIRPEVARILRMAAMVVVAVIAGLLAYAASVRAMASMRAGELLFGVVRYPIWPTRIAIAIGSGLLTVYATRKVYGIYRGSLGGVDGESREPETGEVPSSEG